MEGGKFLGGLIEKAVGGLGGRLLDREDAKVPAIIILLGRVLGLPLGREEGEIPASSAGVGLLDTRLRFIIRLVRAETADGVEGVFDKPDAIEIGRIAFAELLGARDCCEREGGGGGRARCEDWFTFGNTAEC